MASIAVDIDSTLYHFDTIAREACLRLWRETGDDKYREGMYYSSEHWRAPADTLGVERWQRAIAVCHDDDMILRQKPFAGAVETCRALQLSGHHLVFISNRATETESATEEWLWQNHFMLPYLSELVVTTGDKRPYIAECQYIIDDRLKTCVEFVYDYDWQAQHVGTRRHISNFGPSEGPYFDEYMAILAQLLEDYGNDGPLPSKDFAPLKEIGAKAADQYWQTVRRRAFILQYQYNQNATDIPGCYVAPTWAGLGIYMQRHGVLPEIVYEPLSS
jgi:hypothetical protein